MTCRPYGAMGGEEGGLVPGVPPPLAALLSLRERPCRYVSTAITYPDSCIPEPGLCQGPFAVLPCHHWYHKNVIGSRSDTALSPVATVLGQRADTGFTQ